MSIVHPMDIKSPAIFDCAQSGCQECQETLINHHKNLVLAVLHRQCSGDVPYDDLIQEGRIALWQAILHYDPHRGVAFSSYAWVAIERRIWQVVAKEEKAQAKKQLEIQQFSVQNINSLVFAEEALWWEQVSETLNNLLQCLSERQRVVVRAAYGLDEMAVHSLAAIGRYYAVSRESVRLWRNAALAQLRMPVFSTVLRILCAQNSRAAYVRTQSLHRTWLQKQRGGKKR